MRIYETTFILVPSLEEQGITEEVDSIKEFITSHGGEVTEEKLWGRRRLAFPIRNATEGVYYILRFSLDQGQIPELERTFRLNSNMLRYLLLVSEGTPLDQIGRENESEERDRGFRGRGGYRDRERGGDRDRAKSADAKEDAPSSGSTETADSAESTEPVAESADTGAPTPEPVAEPATTSAEGENNHE
ncbi:MAG: 30S ribosomal protein S6 [Gemmatimonadota bacterium]|nr:30S ribosomal protein S6 [Gemmatimonadota bacterium]MDP6529150.1 30S ribosomal protein S6 [Gemmatimonadota bacterium]MDP6802734.1 30S ribosomal protein S6 [Gemmatimonadota bacterium]MDP7031745.1 30S ribosomal protein S6 [Gemmatimonadota bacterium]